ncbi:integrator complex subunit 5-like [Anneissia japonica]|uniref:integrator complex subunit 5-like n=1 Tax=Anneissia japonica TaxID=1529436 RepID=UPI001425A625|nr:integrator complex subunit 5-like [Anneissia japonica]
MAAPMSMRPQQYPADDILNHVRSFVKGCNVRTGQKLTSVEHARCAIKLLRTLPSARAAVFEHLCNVFNESVNTHLCELDGEASIGPCLDEAIHEIYEVLIDFVDINSTTWAPIIFTWSIDLLGQVSRNYALRRGVPHSSNLNEILQLWMTCKGTRTLMDLSTQCMSNMIGSCPDLCVNALLDASVTYSPHFDWVVAHIGSCFPNTIITRVLACGLKDFCNTQSEGAAGPEQKVPKMASVVGILGHLASQHSQDIRKALLELFQESLTSENEQQLQTVPFLLHLATMSIMLLKVITTDFVHSLTPSVLNRLSEQFAKSPIIKRDQESLIHVVIHLICKSGNGAFKLLQFLLETASGNFHDEAGEEKVNQVVQDNCSLVLDLLLLDLQRSVYNKTGSIVQKSSEDHTEIPFLEELQKHTDVLCKDILKTDCKSWLQRLLCLVAVHCGESCGSDILSFIVVNLNDHEKASLFIVLQAEMEAVFPGVLDQTVKKTLSRMQHLDTVASINLLKNLVCLVQWENSPEGRTTPRRRVQDCLQYYLQMITAQLHHSSRDVSSEAIKLMMLIGLPESISLATILNVATSTVDYYFSVLHMEDSAHRLSLLTCCCKVLESLSKKAVGQTILLKELVEGALQQENAFLFSGKVERYVDDATTTSENKLLLLQENQNIGSTVSFSKRMTNVFHGGTVGKGVRPKVKLITIPEDMVLMNVQSFTSVVYSCLGSDPLLSHCATQTGTDPHQTTQSNTSTTVDIPESRRKSGTEVLARLLVEVICPDVTHANSVWPDEEHIRNKMKIDLEIRCKFDNNPILWELMDMVSSDCIAMCHCSPLLYSTLSTVINYWDTTRVSKAKEAPCELQASCNIIKYLSKAQLLAQPFCYIGEILEHLDPHEVFVLLSIVWANMKENPPSDANYVQISTDQPLTRKTPLVCNPKHVETLRSILHQNIDIFGHLFSRFFPTTSTTSI